MTRAFIVIDIQNEYFGGGALPLEQVEQVEARIVVAIKQARAAGDRLILVRHESTGSGPFAAGSAGAAIRPAVLAVADEAPVVVKHYADAFQDTDLRAHLDGIDTLLIAGMMTQNCVVFTALSRDADAFDVHVIGDLCAAPSETVHAIALRALASKRSVVTADAILG